ncbi:Imm8 family immunity protein [Chengkuizengella sp. SCS-71B]|uniref:Imm8 family immunity protein n=1 Tax=Chengkuizengella sp. SCS-71B TaxID=3115290 RepID=UPI0032C22986
MLEIKAISKDENWGEDDNDFYIQFQVYVGVPNIKFSSNLLTFDVVSPTRLSEILETSIIEVGHGYLIMNDFNINTINATIKGIMKNCKSNDYDTYLEKLSKYFRLQD